MTSVHAQNMSSTTISRVHGIFFSSFDASIASYRGERDDHRERKRGGKPQASRCGFMKPSQLQTRDADPRPFYDERQRDRDTAKVTAMSLMRRG